MVRGACVIVHAGAGYHARSKEKAYNAVCLDACLVAAELLSAKSGSAIDAVVAAVSTLEDSCLTNAGFGSNLNISGYVECDAGIMSGSHLKFAGVGAIQNIQNPIKVTNRLLQHQIACPVDRFGRVSPSLLVGDGVRRWAIAHGYGLDVIGHNLVTGPSIRSWNKYRGWLHGLAVTLDNTSDCVSQAKRPKFDRLDTVGAVCLDSSGNVASASSSGGVSLKYEGRLGHACIYGCGCWAEQTESPLNGIGVVTSGTGEQLVRTQLAQRTAEQLITSTDTIPDALRRSLADGFLGSRFTSDEEMKYAGAAGIHFQSFSDDHVAEIFFGHTTQSMSIGYFATGVMSKPVTMVSRISNDNPLRVETVSYRL